MGIFDKLFGGKKDNAKPKETVLGEGDIFYVMHDGKYHVYKLLKVDDDSDTFHVRGYEPIENIPTSKDINSLKVAVGHFPIVATGFPDAIVITKSVVTNDDLSGYHYYLEIMREEEERVARAVAFYKEAYGLTNLKLHQEAIDVYTKAIDLVPDFFEAIDNRAFSKMDMGRWADAIEDFELSLTVKPDSALAEFSIGECYMRLGENLKAKEQFEKTLAIEPDNKHAHDFLNRVNELIANS